MFNASGQLVLIDVERTAPRVVVFTTSGKLVSDHVLEKLVSVTSDSKCRFIGFYKDMLYVADLGMINLDACAYLDEQTCTCTSCMSYFCATSVKLDETVCYF